MTVAPIGFNHDRAASEAHWVRCLSSSRARARGVGLDTDRAVQFTPSSRPIMRLHGRAASIRRGGRDPLGPETPIDRSIDMNGVRSISVAVCVGVSLLASSAHAQFGAAPGQRLLTFGAGGGVAVPVGHAKDAFKNGFNGLAYVRLQPPGLPLGFAVNVTFQRFDFADAQVSSGGTGIAGAKGNSKLIAGLGEVKLDLGRGAIHPYLLAGVGAYNVKTDPDGAATVSETQFGINGGGGLSMRFGRVGAFLQGRVDNVYTKDQGVIDAKSIQVVPVTFGVEF
jgi:hypothetical protein